MQQRSIEVGVLGATGVVGQHFVTRLSRHPWFKPVWLAASEPTVHAPVVDTYVPCDVWAAVKVRPAGSWSVTTTPVAGLGPSLVTVSVYAALVADGRRRGPGSGTIADHCAGPCAP